MIRPDSPIVVEHVSALRATGADCLRAGSLSRARRAYVLAAAWARFAWNACDRDEVDEVACLSALVRSSFRALGRVAL